MSIGGRIFIGGLTSSSIFNAFNLVMDITQLPLPMAIILGVMILGTGVQVAISIGDQDGISTGVQVGNNLT